MKPGPVTPEGRRLREQIWLIPANDAAGTLMWATVFRPPGAGPFPFAVLNHGTGPEREGMTLPTFYWLSRLLVNAGYAVVVPVRRGYGATAGRYEETTGPSCARANYLNSETQSAKDIRAVITFMREQPFLIRDGVIVGGGSTGGLGSVATASLFGEGVAAVINFAGGRGGRAGGKPNSVCNPQELVSLMRLFGRIGPTVPSLWIYAENDSYFGPDLARKMAAAYEENGRKVDLHITPKFKEDGHTLGTDMLGQPIWGPLVLLFLINKVDRPGSAKASVEMRIEPSQGSTEETGRSAR